MRCSACYKAALVAALIVEFLLLCGCSGLKDFSYKPEVPEAAREKLKSATDRLSVHERADAVSRLEELLREYPLYVDAHRCLQDIYLAENRYGYLVNRYRDLRDGSPGSAVFHYLYGRVLSNPENQIEAFSKAVNLDRSFFWGYNGLGFAFRKCGDFGACEDAYRGAIRSAPWKAEPYVGLISLFLSTGKLDRAEKLLSKALKLFPENLQLFMLRARWIADEEGPIEALGVLLSVAPETELNSRFFGFLLDLLDNVPDDRFLRRVLYRFGPLTAGRDNGYGVVLDRILGVCCRKLGDLSGARRYFSRAYEAAPADARVRRELRYIHAVSGKLSEAFAVQTSACPQEWIDGSRLKSVESKVLALVNGRNGDLQASIDQERLCELAVLLMEIGWLEEASSYLSRIADHPSATGRKARSLLNDIYRHKHFELALREFFLAQYKAFQAGGPVLDLDQALKRLGGISSEILGTDLFQAASFVDFGLVGVLMNTSVCEGGVIEYFRKFNRFFIMGRRAGGPVEAYLLDVFDRRPGSVCEVGGVEIEFDLVRCENPHIPSFVEYIGGNVAGVGLHSIVAINIDMIRMISHRAHETYRRFHENEAVLLSDSPPRACGPASARDVSEPLGLSKRLSYVSFRAAGAPDGLPAYMKMRFDVVLTHEVQHLADAREFLPISKNLFRAACRFVMEGFSAFNVEAWLEKRAQLNALLRSQDPHAVLSEIAEHMDVYSSRTPHGKGYRRLMKDLVEEVHSRPEEFAAIDGNSNILHQLHKLSRIELQKAAGALAAEEGLGNAGGKVVTITPHPRGE